MIVHTDAHEPHWMPSWAGGNMAVPACRLGPRLPVHSSAPHCPQPAPVCCARPALPRQPRCAAPSRATFANGCCCCCCCFILAHSLPAWAPVWSPQPVALQAECTREHGPQQRLGTPKELITAFTTPDAVTTTTPRSPPAAYPPPPASPVPARWSLTNRIFNLNLRSLYQGPPRLPAARLWNPVNSSPRTLQLQHPPPTAPPPDDCYPNLPVNTDTPQATEDVRDEYPLLTLPQQRLSRQSQVPSSLAVERSTGDNSASLSARTSIGLPRPPPRSLHSPGIAMSSSSPIVAQHSDKDVEAGRAPPPGLSRVSLPNSRRTSIGSRPSAAGGADDEDGDAASEFPWGPSHPCFPHPNPHVPLDSELYNSTRIIRIKRDWMVKGDLAPTFANLYPEILDPLVTEDDFRILIKKINDTLIEAFDPFSFRACLDTVMGVATLWLWEDAGFTGVKKQLTELERWIDDWNHDIGAKEAVKIIPLRRTGYLTLDIQIPDPHLGPDTGSRPGTQDDGRHIDSPQETDPYLPYSIPPTLQVNSQPAAVEAQS
ncbi:hypothetical protein yc1106_05820 [Curvularia clavata]|uniref:Ras modification protein ERF4 n=1 Tax=Curvularia clavata TaxID=95742 RepID=A0A9Q9DUL3_CURCL|nr:hypothetical protein yc1106_05820 [Curvularia clavata]